MTLGDMVDLVCAKMHRTDDESQAEARKYIRSRYQIIWDTRLWRDSLGLLPLTGITEQIVTLPIIVSKVIACRWGTTATLQNENLDTLFFLDPNRFNQIGQPISFTIYSPSALPLSPGGGILKLLSTSNDATYDVTIRGSLANVDQSEVVALSGTSVVSSVYSYDDVLSLSKDSSSLDLIVRKSDNTQLMVLPADETERLHQRLHLHSDPLDADSMLILYKRRIKNLIRDSDSTELGGIVDNMLLAAAISDMREGERQFTKAAQKSQEVAGLMEMAMAAEKEHSAFNARIIPYIYDDEFGWDEITKNLM